MIFPRSITSTLLEWSKSTHRKPLVIRGARQVGKTVIVREFAASFDHYIEMNLDMMQNAELFRRGLNIRDLFQAILLKSGKTFTPDTRTILFLDEIQSCPEAVECLRYFHEDLPEVFVIAAGSLLEVALYNRHISFPVGRVEYRYLYPLSFKEYLIAAGLESVVSAYDQLPFPSYAHEVMLDHFHRYTLLGGMPEIVAAYLDRKEISGLTSIYNSLMISYLDDVGKYARNPTNSIILRHCIQTAPLMAAQRITFAGFGNSAYRSREVGEALKTLEQAMLLNLIYPATGVDIPILPNLKKSPRLQFVDTGLINYAAGLQGHYFQHRDLHSFYRGLIAEHIVNQELLSLSFDHNHKPCFWVREKSQSNAEVDIILQHENWVIPVEVKSGKTGTLRSLHQFVDSCPHHFAIRLHAGEFKLEHLSTPKGKKYLLLNLPYFLAAKIPDYISFLISESA